MDPDGSRNGGKPPPVRVSLHARVLLITLALLTLGELAIYVPSIAIYRTQFLDEQVNTAHLSTLLVHAAGRGGIGRETERQLLEFTGADAIILRDGNTSQLVIGTTPDMIHDTIIVHDERWDRVSLDTMESILFGGDRPIRVVGMARQSSDLSVEVVTRDTALVEALRTFSIRMLGLSLGLALFVGAFLFLSLRWLLIRPITNLTSQLAAFASRPADASTLIRASGRTDEIGDLEHSLASMQAEVRNAIRRRHREATLGVSVSKVNHDLRNVLAGAVVTTDRIAQSKDPLVSQVMPHLMDAIERAVQLSSRTLDYLRFGDLPPRRSRFRFHSLAEAVARCVPAFASGGAEWNNRIPPDLEYEGDREQMFRALLNLFDNSVKAMDGQGSVTVTGTVLPDSIRIAVADTGPGLDGDVRASFTDRSPAPLIQGLGLAIAREIAASHDGQLVLDETWTDGTRLVLELPTGQRGSGAPARPSRRGSAAPVRIPSSPTTIT